VNREIGYKVYLAGELFDMKHLAGNALLAEALGEVSEARYNPVLPQNLELPSLEAKAIRDTDYAALLECDAAISMPGALGESERSEARRLIGKTYDLEFSG
jgi:nucleoside 2-deoxyribosyltransferase